MLCHGIKIFEPHSLGVQSRYLCTRGTSSAITCNYWSSLTPYLKLAPLSRTAWSWPSNCTLCHNAGLSDTLTTIERWLPLLILTVRPIQWVAPWQLLENKPNVFAKQSRNRWHSQGNTSSFNYIRTSTYLSSWHEQMLDLQVSEGQMWWASRKWVSSLPEIPPGMRRLRCESVLDYR